MVHCIQFCAVSTKTVSLQVGVAYWKHSKLSEQANPAISQLEIWIQPNDFDLNQKQAPTSGVLARLQDLLSAKNVWPQESQGKNLTIFQSRIPFSLFWRCRSFISLCITERKNGEEIHIAETLSFLSPVLCLLLIIFFKVIWHKAVCIIKVFTKLLKLYRNLFALACNY